MLASFAAVVALVPLAVVTAVPAQADAPNTATAYVQPMKACTSGRMNVMWCEGNLGGPIRISADPAVSTPLWANTGYALCWTTAAGATLPAGANCTPNGSATASGNDFTLPTTDAFPLTMVDSGGSGCALHVNNAQNSYVFFLHSQGTCTITVPTPAAPGFTAATTVFTLPVVAAPAPAINGDITARSGRGRVGRSAPLQTVTCNYQAQFSVFTDCPGVVLTWSVLTGRKSCRIGTDADTASETLGSVRLRFIRPGRCTVQGSYPASPGRWQALTTSTFTYTVSRRGA